MHDAPAYATGNTFANPWPLAAGMARLPLSSSQVRRPPRTRNRSLRDFAPWPLAHPWLRPPIPRLKTALSRRILSRASSH
ncbi:MAG TPA: hypothetical protein VKR26_01340, partial [Terriglobales bacterium]|nr:hypothetical protein [Terriglobales bacterium]